MNLRLIAELKRLAERENKLGLSIEVENLVRLLHKGDIEGFKRRIKSLQALQRDLVYKKNMELAA